MSNKKLTTMEYLLETNFYLFIIVVYILSFTTIGAMLGIMALFEEWPVPLMEIVKTVLKGLFFIIILSFILGTLSYGLGVLGENCNIDSSCYPEYLPY